MGCRPRSYRFVGVTSNATLSPDGAVAVAVAHCAEMLRALFGLDVAAADPFSLSELEVQALAHANARVALSDLADLFRAHRSVGPLAKPSDAAFDALRVLDTVADASNVFDAARALRGAAAHLHDALSDPALALPQHMPAEHLAAVYAPLVAPLVAPLGYGLYDELRRYRRLERAKRA